MHEQPRALGIELSPYLPVRNLAQPVSGTSKDYRISSDYECSKNGKRAAVPIYKVNPAHGNSLSIRLSFLRQRTRLPRPDARINGALISQVTLRLLAGGGQREAQIRLGLSC